MTPPLQKCPACGCAHEGSGLAGNCPACLAQAMLAGGSDDEPDPGLRLGEYDLIREAGRGGMGVVYQAWQRSLQREVALKVLAGGEFAHASLRGHLQREARALARLQHPNIVPVYEVGEADGVAFLAMEYIPGRSLAEAVKDGPLTPLRAAALMRKVAEAVAHAHSNDVIHRDLKPSNILLDGRGEPRVADFGLARLPEVAGVSLTGHALGTPAYAAPEQLRPVAGPTDQTGPKDQPGPTAAAVDVYSLGATLYHLLTGRPPFVGDSAAAVMLQVMEADPLPPARINPSVPKDLDTICRKAMAKEPASRYGGAQELADDLGRFLEGRAILARRSRAMELLWCWCRRRPAVAALALTCVMAVVLGSLGILVQWRRAEATAVVERSQREQARQNERAARLQGYVADMYAAGQSLRSEDSGLARRLVEEMRPAPGGEDFRGVEWRVLHGMTRGQDTGVMEGHPWIVGCMESSPDGKWLASGGRAVVGLEAGQSTARVWDVATRQAAWVCPPDSGSVRSIGFSGDGSRLLLAARGKARLLKAGTWEETGYVRPGTVAALARRHPWLAVLTNGEVAVHDYETGAEVRRRPGGGTDAVVFSPQDQWLAAAGREMGVQLTGLGAGAVERRLPVTVPAAALAFSPDERWLAAACGAQILLWDLSRPESPPASLTGHRLDIWGLTFMPDGRLVSAGSDRTVRFWAWQESWQAAGILRGHRDEVWCAASDPAGKWLATGGKDTTVRFWPPRPPAEAAAPPHEVSLPPAWSGDGKTVLLRPREAPEAVLWDPLRGSQVNRWPGVYNASMPDGGWVRLVSDPPRLDFCDAEGRHGRSVPLEGKVIINMRHYSRSFSADRRRIAVVLDTSEVAVWEIATGRLLGRFSRAPGAISLPTALSADGRLLAMAGSTVAAVDLVEIDSGRRQRFTGHMARVTCLGFSPDGRLLASGSVDASVRLWNTATGALEGILRGHLQDVDSLAWSPDGRTLGSLGRFESLRLWNLETRRQVLEIPVPKGGHNMTFSPDGHWISVNLCEPDDRTNNRVQFIRATPPEP